MNNIDKAIERLDEITSVHCGGEFTHFHTVDLNNCRSEIKALLTAIAEEAVWADTPKIVDTFKTLIQKIKGESK